MNRLKTVIKCFIGSLLLGGLALLPQASTTGASQPPNQDTHHKRGARPTPRHKLLSANQFRPTKAAPLQAAWIPSKLSMWLNDQYGDCVTAEEAFAKACNGILITDSVVQAWASKNGVLNGADLGQVLGMMQSSGFPQDSNMYNDGSYATVDYSTESVLQSAISVGPVKIGIDADALPSGAGNKSGWVGIGGKPQQFNNEDHCVSLAGYGTAQYLFSQLQVPLPSNLQPTQTGYLLFTWNTIGFVDHAWIMSTCGEAWVRTPTTVIVGSGTPNPDPPLNPQPTPVPPIPVPPTPTPPSPIPPVPGPVTTITLNNQLQPGTYEISTAGTKAAADQVMAAVQAYNSIVQPNNPPTPVPGPGGLEQRVSVLETGISKLINIVAAIQAKLGGSK